MRSLQRRFRDGGRRKHYFTTETQRHRVKKQKTQSEITEGTEITEVSRQSESDEAQGLRLESNVPVSVRLISDPCLCGEQGLVTEVMQSNR